MSYIYLPKCNVSYCKIILHLKLKVRNKRRLSNPEVAGLQQRGERPMSKILSSVSFFFFTRMTCMTTFPWVKFSLDCTSVEVSRAAYQCVSVMKFGEALWQSKDIN